MCRRLITHRMHHDVATPMIIDPIAFSPILYANPLRTPPHRCELESTPLELMFSRPVERCIYHSCCIPRDSIQYCVAFLYDYSDDENDSDYDLDFEPEECPDFVLEHHHERLPYFGHPEFYMESIPASWRNLVYLRADRADWFPAFAHNSAKRVRWEAAFFEACEKLFIFEADAQTIYLVTQNMLRYGPMCPWARVRRSRANYLAAELKINKQRMLITHLLEWALTPRIEEGIRGGLGLGGGCASQSS
ncbi:hypothetical protein GGS21DRAFT_247236 [Xylaria nigripes]|nr:hypothetical protein GGS21DRAFT_247236 [Xylaria nigripes]